MKAGMVGIGQNGKRQERSMVEMSCDNLLKTQDEMAKVYKQYETWVDADGGQK